MKDVYVAESLLYIDAFFCNKDGIGDSFWQRYLVVFSCNFRAMLNLTLADTQTFESQCTLWSYSNTSVSTLQISIDPISSKAIVVRSIDLTNSNNQESKFNVLIYGLDSISKNLTFYGQELKPFYQFEYPVDINENSNNNFVNRTFSETFNGAFSIPCSDGVILGNMSIKAADMFTKIYRSQTRLTPYSYYTSTQKNLNNGSPLANSNVSPPLLFYNLYESNTSLNMTFVNATFEVVLSKNLSNDITTNNSNDDSSEEHLQSKEIVQNIDFYLKLKDQDNITIQSCFETSIQIDYSITLNPEKIEVIDNNQINFDQSFEGIVQDSIISCSLGQTIHVVNTKNLNTIRCMDKAQACDMIDQGLDKQKYRYTSKMFPNEYTYYRMIDKKFDYTIKPVFDKLGRIKSCKDKV